MSKGKILMNELTNLLDYYKAVTGKTNLTVSQATNLNVEFKKMIEKEIK